MAISAIIISLSDDQDSRNRALALLEREDCLTLGAIEGCCLPAVLETPSLRDDRTCFQRIGEIPGVLRVDLVYVHFETGV